LSHRVMLRIRENALVRSSEDDEGVIKDIVESVPVPL